MIQQYNGSKGGMAVNKFTELRLKLCRIGSTLLKLFLASSLVLILLHAALIPVWLQQHWLVFAASAAFWVLAEATVFWIGIICVYVVSVQLGVRLRVLGIVFGMIPIANLIMLGKIIRTVDAEYRFETQKLALNAARKDEKLCETKYPILLVHGVFFRDTRYFDYWGRIPHELKENGATVYYGEQPSAASIKECAAALAKRIHTIVDETGCEKVNIIAHSKGGLDCRCMLSDPENAALVASLTTVNTPHRGCSFVDALLETVPEKVKRKVAAAYDISLHKLGEADADFMAAVHDLTEEQCLKMNEQLPTPTDVYCQSVGSTLARATGGKFPLNLSYHLVHLFNGANDGLVSETSFAWGEKYTLLTTKHKRGISHGDMIDLNRENLPDFDVREFYVQLVHSLKEKGL